jgi:hypothetical protein
MAEFDPKPQFKGNIKPYLKAIKARLNQIESVATSVTGTFRGTHDTLALMASANPTAKAGDWAILRTDDGANESGIYVKGPTAWEFVQDITNFNEIIEAIIATDAEALAGTSTTKAVNPKQLKEAITEKSSQDRMFTQGKVDALKTETEAYVSGVLQAYANKNGNQQNTFEVNFAAENSFQAVNAAQMTFTITDAEALADFENA